MLKEENRLTYQDENGVFGLTCGQLPDKMVNFDLLHELTSWIEPEVPICDAVQRLGAYEATGYAPEELAAPGSTAEPLGDEQVLELCFPNKESCELASQALEMAGYPVQSYSESNEYILAVKMSVN